jgi:DNA polymerase-3 subunit epsilon
VIRYIVFDTETTGLDPFSGDKIIEIGAVELLDKQRSGKTYRQLINPEMKISQEVIDITHITNEMVAGQPNFRDAIGGFLSFIEGNVDIKCEKTILVAHNASFDLKFLNHQLKQEGIEDMSKFDVIDTLDLARQRFPGQKATLDMLCERFGISLEERKKEGHGALLDSQILADVFVKLTEGNRNALEQIDEVDFVGFPHREQLVSRNFSLTDNENEEHKNFLEKNGLGEF